LLIHGANGRMGQALQRLCAEGDGCRVAAAISRKVGQRVIDGVPQFASSELAAVPEFDVAVDFSLPEGFDPVLALCLERGKALVSGTTGLSDAQRAAIAQAGTRIPVLWAANFSLGVAVLGELVECAARALPGWDFDIVESHHAQKKDAPSGTALALAEAAASGGAITPRYASIRAGDIVGEHFVQFTTMGERIELVHRATNRDVFAHGALHAAARLAKCTPGTYRLADLIA
jgi:4-hydroxy-tetrahydrodipicolinate reductase